MAQQLSKVNQINLVTINVDLGPTIETKRSQVNNNSLGKKVFSHIIFTVMFNYFNIVSPRGREITARQSRSMRDVYLYNTFVLSLTSPLVRG